MKRTVSSTGFAWEIKGSSSVQDVSNPTSNVTNPKMPYGPRWFKNLKDQESQQAKVARSEREDVKQYIDPSGALLEVGACCGSLSFEFRQEFPDKELVLVEPEARNVEFLSRRFSTDNKITILPVAFGNKTSVSNLYLSSDITRHTFIDQLKDINTKESVLTPVVKGSELLGTFPGLIRKISTMYLDVCGMEYQAIEGLLPAITDLRYKGRPTIIVNNDYGIRLDVPYATNVANILFTFGYARFDFLTALSSLDKVVFQGFYSRRGV